MPPQPAFSFEDYSFTAEYFHILKDLSFSVRQGESVALVGPTGSGKSLLLNVMMQGIWDGHAKGKDRNWNQKGSLKILGYECCPSLPSEQTIDELQSQIVLLRGDSIWLPLSVSENFIAVQNLMGIKSPKSFSQIIEEMTESSKIRSVLQSFAELNPSAIDSPYLQFLAVIRALVRKPKVMLLDESLVCLDPILLRQVENMLTRHASGTTIIWATNDLYQASRVTDKTLFLSSGSIAEFTETPKFFTNPKTHEAECFIAGKEWN